MKYADLIAKLTLEEKAGLTSGRDFWHTKAVERLGIPSEMMTDGPHGLRKKVGATMNIILAATLAQGRTIIENAAREPHIVDLANFLNSMGADVRGAGTDTVKVNGVDRLHGGTYTIIPDQIEAGTYMVAAAATGGEVLVKNVIPKHLECISAKLRETGTIVQEYEDCVLVKGNGHLRKANVKTLPYPGFPTGCRIALC